ncbi:MAG: LptF/LptG family permease [Bacteriovoracaceae bacterium]|jgi:lipopolysaccharide export system permease protein|nr:LptF/LptG family permease [Bacteriovoracaceae bacterium]
MSLLSKFISKTWFSSLFGALIVLFLLVSVGDIINGFLQNYSGRRIFIEYFLKLPDLAGKMLPISALLASLFSINKLKTHSELMAILASGYSAAKIYRLILGCSVLVAILQLLNLGYVLPYANKIKRQEFEKSKKNESKYLARSRIGDSGLIWYKTNNYFTSFKAFDSKNKLLKDVTIYFTTESSKLNSIYKAKHAKFLSENKWQLDDIQIIQSLETDQFPEPTTAKSLIIQLNESPEDFTQFESDITTLNLFDLNNFISRLQETDINSTEYQVMLNEKISLAIICIIFALFPLSSVFNPNRRAASFGKSVVYTLIFSIFFWGIHTSSIAMGNSSRLPVLIATFGIPLIFGLYIFGIFLKNKKL